jgi:hypothetical protein
MLIKHMTILFFLTSCALFRTQPSLKDMDKAKLLDAVQLLGEGRGRLSLGQSQYVFGYDSILKENHDWILAVQIPLHGEEVMIFPDLKLANIDNAEAESFEERIKNEFERLKLNQRLTTKEFLHELRSLVRFNLSTQLEEKRDCKAQQSELICEFSGEKYYVSATDKEFRIKKILNQGMSLVLDGKNLTESFFDQTDIRLYANKEDLEKKNSSFSLELFWKK